MRIHNFTSCAAVAAALLMTACSGAGDGADASGPAASTAGVDAMSTNLSDNPLLSQSDLYLLYPPFDQIRNEHYLPAFEQGMAEQLAEIEAITSRDAPPTFNNTIVPLERSGQLLGRVSIAFFSLNSAHTNEGMGEIEGEIAPRLSSHSDRILLDSALFARVRTVYEQREAEDLNGESLRLVEETYRQFVRAGAQLDDKQKARLREINTQIAETQTAFRQNVMNEVNAMAVVVDTLEELAGLTDAQIDAAASEAAERGLEGKYVVPLRNTTQQPPVAQLENRAVRQRMTELSMSRGHRGGEFDNTDELTTVARLRAERAQLLGYATHAAYELDDQTAKTVDAVNERLAQLIPPALANARAEAADLQAMIDAEGGGFELAAWDWDYYADKVRAERYAFDASELRPYFELDSVLVNGVFYAAEQVFGLTFEERDDLPVYHDTVTVYEVFEEDGSTLGLFIFDPYERASKRGGAWMNAYVSQSHMLGTKPVVANHLNVTQPPEGEPTLLTFDEVITAFHEFGHALHGLFSDVTFPSFSGTSVPPDFVEYPSQVNEMWALWPEVLRNYARHYETGEPMPGELLDKVLASRQFNQGYATTEYLLASLIDQKLHQLGPGEVPEADELMAFEAQVLADAGGDLSVVPPRYRYPYFSHIIGGYAAGYYSYIWSEVLDADTVEWFKEHGGMTRENGQRFRDALLSRGGSKEAMTLYREFRGRDPDTQPLLERRGLTAGASP